jgi:flagellar M-ring protein FliF
VKGLGEFLKSLGAARIAAMVAVAIALIGFFAFLIMRMAAPQMTMLFSDLSLEDSGAIIKDLERQAIPFQLRNDGAIIMVPHDRVARLRMKLAEGGLPKGGGVGYEIFDRSDTLGATSFVQNVNHTRALEGGLHHPGDRPGADGARPPGAAGAAIVLARPAGGLGVDRAQGPRYA